MGGPLACSLSPRALESVDLEGSHSPLPALPWTGSTLPVLCFASFYSLCLDWHPALSSKISGVPVPPNSSNCLPPGCILTDHHSISLAFLMTLRVTHLSSVYPDTQQKLLSGSSGMSNFRSIQLILVKTIVLFHMDFFRRCKLFCSFLVVSQLLITYLMFLFL